MAEKFSQEQIRNFAIIAHIDHGKSTLADRLLEATGTVPKRAMREQFLDNMELERERGITIKLKTVRMEYKRDGIVTDLERIDTDPIRENQLPIRDNPVFYVLNLIDTPGHVDFSYEVSRSLAACEGALLLVDASQGVQAQTVSNAYKALDLGLAIIPVINKIDIEYADPKTTVRELQEHFGFASDEIIYTSGKEGIGTNEVLEAIAERIPAPAGDSKVPLRALVFDSFYDEYKGAIAVVKVADGEFKIPTTPGGPNVKQSSKSQIQKLERFETLEFTNQQSTINNQQLYFIGSKQSCTPLEIGYFMPGMTSSDQLLTGEVGYVATGLKDISKVGVGDTVTQRSAACPERSRRVSRQQSAGQWADRSRQGKESDSLRRKESDSGELPAVKPLPGYREPKPVVFANIFPVDKDDFPRLKDGLGKLNLNDAALEYRPASSLALGRGFELGLLGVLHLEIVKERLEREYGLDLVVTAPTVEYEVRIKSQTLGFQGLSPASPAGGSKTPLELSPLESGSGKPAKQKIKSAVELPKEYEALLEPWAEVKILTPYDYIGAVMRVISEARGEFLDQIDLGGKRVRIICGLPLAELISNFYDQLKSASSGFASLNWELTDHRPVEAGKLEVLINKEAVEPFSRIVVKDQAYQVARMLVKKLKKILPREQFAVPLQAVFNGRVIARETIPAMRKDVTAKLYGGDQTRKDKLLKRQKKGKKKLARIGKVGLPKEAFLEVLRV